MNDSQKTKTWSATMLQGLTPDQIRKIVNNNADREKNTPPKKKKIAAKPKPEHAFRAYQPHDLGVLLRMPFSSTHGVSLYDTPGQFINKNKAQVSVVVPVCDTNVTNLIQSWDLRNDGYHLEILFIDDDCVAPVKDQILAEWSKKDALDPGGKTSDSSSLATPTIKIYKSPSPQGWNACCNIGAERATAEFVVFVHPESVLSPGWLRSLLRVMRNPEIGIASGVQINPETSRINDWGSYWSWDDQMFLKRGAESYNEIKLDNPFAIDNIPATMLDVHDCHKASSYCMVVRRDEFRRLGGFNANLASPEWSDADLCSFYREKGMRVLVQPNSRIRLVKKEEDYRSVYARVYFENKWVRTGRLDKFVSKRKDARKPIESILIRRRAAHGDVLVAASVASALKKKHPGCKILFTTEVPELVKDNPWIDRVVETQSERLFDHYIDLDMSYEYRPDVNMQEAFADAAGVSVDDCQFFMSTEAVEFELPEKYAVIHAGQTLWAGRNWPTIKFDSISNKIKSMGYEVICVGTTFDYKTVSCDHDLRDKTNLWQLGYVIKNSSFFIGIDSLPMQIAQALNVPGVAVFGSIKPETRLVRKSSIVPVVARGLGCLGCHHRKPTPCTATSFCEIGVQECMNNIPVDDVWKAIESKI